MVAMAFACSGCASSGRLEVAWQTAHALDTLQTLAIAGDPACYYESYPLARRMIGRHPEEAEVMAWMATVAFAHAFVSNRLEPWPVWQRVWQTSTLAFASHTVLRNHRIGLRIDGDNVPCR